MKILGINDEVTTCECCGRTNLKRTVILESETIGIVRYGTDCAAAAVYGKKSAKNRDQMDRVARGVAYAKKWIGIHGTTPAVLNKIADAISVHFCWVRVIPNGLLVGGETVLS